jgi:superfamily I DNA/RNA helicase
MIYSSEQQAIFTHFATGTGNLVIEAFAGTGKTTTIKEAFDHAPERQILYAVFNKKNQREAQEKITDPRVDVRTLHSLGFAYIKRRWKDTKPDDEVEHDRIHSILRKSGLHENHELLASSIKLVGFLKNTMINPTEAEARDIAQERDCLLDDTQTNDRIIRTALEALTLAKTRDAQGRISFDDMVWLPVAMDWVYNCYDMVTVDEAQDMNMPQLVMARKSTNGRIIVVGDSRQAIYGFRGAVQDAMNMMRITLRAKTLSLTTTYRCPKAVVRIAQEIVPAYQSAATAPEGEVLHKGDILLSATVGDAILSRMNAPLTPLALSLIRKGIAARIEGRDIAIQLLAMVRTLRAGSVPDFLKKVEAWLSKQIERLQRTKTPEKKIEQARDIAETLKALAQDTKGMPDVETRINSMFQDTDATSKPCVILSSVHKAKGLEWNRVWLLTETFRKGKGVEEDNIWYVAVTRAKQSLFLVKSSVPEKLQVVKSSTCDPQKPNDYRISRAERIAELQKLKTPDSEILSIIRLEFPERKVAEFKLPTIPSASPFSIKFLPGDIIVSKPGGEFVCYKSNDSAARFICVTQLSNKFDRCNTYDPRMEQIIRRMDEMELITLLAGKTGARKVSNNNPGEESNNTMATKTKIEKTPKAPKTSTPKITSKLTGAAEYVRTRYNEGANKITVFAEAVEKWPAFNHDKIGLESRWNTAERIAKGRKEKAKAEKAGEKAPARPVKATAKKTATPTPPARKKKTASAPVPVDGPIPVTTEVPPTRPQTTEIASTGV